MNDNVKLSPKLADLDKSFGLDDALRIKTLLESKTSKPVQKAEHTAQASKAEASSKDVVQACDLGSWTPLDLRARSKVSHLIFM